MQPGDITHTAIISGDEMIIREARYAGIDGPIYCLPLPADLDRADAMLEEKRFQRITPWAVRKTYEGLALEATLLEN
jgi:hypothetical protein